MKPDSDKYNGKHDNDAHLNGEDHEHEHNGNNHHHKYVNVDPLSPAYRESLIETPERHDAIREGNIALLCIDLQYLDAARGHGVFADETTAGVPKAAQEYYFSMLEKVVLPNVRRLQDAFREHDLEVIHIRIQSLTQDGRDRSMGHKRLGLHAAPGSKEAQILEEVKPVGDEMVISKTSSGVFASTNIYYVLRNLDIDSLFICGVYTDECVSTTIRDAADYGFLVTLISDGCATVTQERHEFTQATLKDRYTRIMSADEAIDEITRITANHVNSSSPSQ
ncbi:isochorismatase family protein [candidate division GN15 bacterium]|nr:isochorismatase family protein [candidate division GN15 bacterium]